MYLTWDIFQFKPGMAKELVKIFKQTIPFMEEQNLKDVRIMNNE